SSRRRTVNGSGWETCAAGIWKRLTNQAHRGGATADDIHDALEFYQKGRKGGDFENGVRLALQSVLVSPRFLFRLEHPSTVGARPTVARAASQMLRISDQDLASRLSFFLWASVPDAELVKAANNGSLRSPRGVEKKV